MSALADFRTAILALLDDASQARFPSAQIDQALRWALNEYSRSRPFVQAYGFEADGTRINPMPAGFAAFRILKVEILGDSPDENVEIPFYAYQVDGLWFFETVDRVVPAGKDFSVTYAGAHTVDDLDSATQTTLPGADEAIVQVGAAGHAAEMRAMSRVEANNLDSRTVAEYRELAGRYLAAFEAALISRPGAAFGQVGTPPTDTF